MSKFLRELQRRNVIRAALLYLPAAWGIAQIVDVIGPAFGWPDSALRNTIIGLVLLFPAVLVLAWIFEFTPEGLRLDSGPSAVSQPDARTGKLLDRWIIAVLLVAVLILAVDEFIIEPTPERRSIAVFPFDNLNRDEGYDYLSDGIPMQILTSLSSQGSFDVIARETTEKLADYAGDLAKIREYLNVDYALFGTVQVSPEEIRTYARLVDLDTEQQIWAETIDAPAGRAFEIQDKIANTVLASLPGGQPSAAIETYVPADPRAWHAYLAGKEAMSTRSLEMLSTAKEEFRRAIELDPNYGAAYAGLSMSSGLYSVYTHQSPQHFPELISLAEKAVELAPDLGEAYTALGYAHFLQRFDSQSRFNAAKVESLFRKALNLDPAFANTYTWLAIVIQRYKGDYSGYITVLEEGLQHNPGSEVLRSNYIEALRSRGRYDEADVQLERLKPYSLVWYENMKDGVLSRTYLDRSSRTITLMRKVAELDLLRGAHIFDMARCLVAIGLPAEARIIARELGPMGRLYIEFLTGMQDDFDDEIAAHLTPLSDYQLGWILAEQGNYAKAAEHMETAWDHVGHLVTFHEFASPGAALLATLRRINDQAVDKDNLLEAMRDDVRRMHKAGIVRVHANSVVHTPDSLEGFYELARRNHARAVALFHEAIDDGVYLHFDHLYFRRVMHRPEYQRLRDAFLQIQTRERRELLDIVCTNNPYPEVWKPLPKTCEEHQESIASL